MFLPRLILSLLPLAACITADPATSSNTKTCKDGPVTLRSRQCSRTCGYEYTGGSYKNEYKSCYSECADACAADSRCINAKWNYFSKQCYYSDRSSYWQKTGRGDGVKCQKPTMKTTCTTTMTTTSSSTTTTSSTTTSAAPAGPTCSIKPGDPCQGFSCVRIITLTARRQLPFAMFTDRPKQPGCDDLTCSINGSGSLESGFSCKTCLHTGQACPNPLDTCVSCFDFSRSVV